LAAGVGLAGGCATRDAVTGRRDYNMFSLEEEVALGQATVRANTETLVKQGVAVNRDPARVEQLGAMVRRIGAVSDLPELPYTVTLYHTNIVNAAAAPGGSLMVYEGLYDPEVGLVRDEDELAAVIAHEIAHVTCRHVAEQVSKAKTANVVSGAVGMLADIFGYGNVYDLAEGVLSVSSVVWLPAYSRRDEQEADRVGLLYMARAGYDPRAAPRLWRRAAEDPAQQGGGGIFSSHPSHGDRERILAAAMPEAMEAYRRARGDDPAGFDPAGR
jgi:predicted Zn-dependent protease